MKKTLIVNLNGIAFNIDDDAYDMLKSYLDGVGSHFTEDEREEIMKDIESRIAELFSARLSGRNVIEQKDVEEVISTLGKPSDFGDASEIQEPTKETKRIHRKFYRDSDDKILGGVASGIAAYIGWDVTLIRILLTVFLFCSVGTAFLLYMLLWIVVPEAITTAQKLEMQGIEPNIDNIKNFVPKGPVERTRGGEVIFGILKAIFILALGFISLTFVGLAFCFILCAFIATSSVMEVLAWVAGVFFVLIPAVGAFLLCLRLINNRLPHRRWVGWILFLLWVLSLFLLCYSSNQIINTPKTQHWIASVVNKATAVDEEDMVTEERLFANFDAISADAAIRVEVIQADSFSLAVKAYPDEIRNIDLTIEEGKLKIHRDGEGNLHLATVYVTMPQLREVKLDAASSLYISEPITATKLIVELHAGSKCDIEQGAIDTLVLDAHAASRVNLPNVDLKVVTADAHAASTIHFGKVQDELHLSAAEVSNITYKGNPKVKVIDEANLSSVKHVKE